MWNFSLIKLPAYFSGGIVFSRPFRVIDEDCKILFQALRDNVKDVNSGILLHIRAERCVYQKKIEFVIREMPCETIEYAHLFIHVWNKLAIQLDNPCRIRKLIILGEELNPFQVAFHYCMSCRRICSRILADKLRALPQAQLLT